MKERCQQWKKARLLLLRWKNVPQTCFISYDRKGRTFSAHLPGNTLWRKVSLCNRKTVMLFSQGCYQCVSVYYHIRGTNSLSVWSLVISVSLSMSEIHVQNKEVNYDKEIILLLLNNEALFKHNRAHESTWVWIPLWEGGQISFPSPPLLPPFRGMRSHQRADSIWRQWSPNLNPFPLQSTQRLTKRHTNFSCDT